MNLDINLSSLSSQRSEFKSCLEGTCGTKTTFRSYIWGPSRLRLVSDYHLHWISIFGVFLGQAADVV